MTWRMVLLFSLLLAGCDTVNWSRAGEELARSACDSLDNCSRPCQLGERPRPEDGPAGGCLGRFIPR